MDKFSDIIKKVQKPGRYIGGETNSIRKSPRKDRTSVVLAYPDTYEVGMSYLGLRILYHLLNESDDIACERVFMPWDDMEQELTSSGIKLFSLETRRAINGFDIIGFSLSYELTYTNVLSMLKLGGVTVESEKRKDEEPLVIAGGTAAYNPEPMSKFIDAFIIGDGEEALPRFVDEYRKAGSKTKKRRELLKALSKLDGVYVPSLYKARYSEGRFLGTAPLEEDVPEKVEKAVVKNLGQAYYPAKQIVPFIRIVHDRMAIEIMRGCPNRCRFCQASAVNGPLRLRTPHEIRRISRETYKYTGYERLALLSLSSVNYPKLPEVVKSLTEDFKDKGVAISVPSLRVDEAFYDLPEMISAIRKTSLTFAPEAASEVMREALAKNIDLEVLCRSASVAFQHGWRRLKLYFMVGFPRESGDEAQNIIKLARRLSDIRKKTSKGGAEIKVSVNSFIPKPHTPLQWTGMKSIETLAGIRSELIKGSSRKVRVEFHDLEQSLVEASLSRGDRRLANVILTAWQKGAKMDGWRDFFNFSIWQEAFKENGLDIYDYASRAFSLDEVLPWDHIKIALDKSSLKEEFIKSGLKE